MNTDILRPRVVTAYSRIWWEGDGDEYGEDYGWHDEEGYDCSLDKWDKEEGLTPAQKAVDFILENGAIEVSTGPYRRDQISPSGEWYYTDYLMDMHTGVEEQLSFHLKGFTDSESRFVYRLFNECSTTKEVQEYIDKLRSTKGLETKNLS